MWMRTGRGRGGGERQEGRLAGEGGLTGGEARGEVGVLRRLVFKQRVDAGRCSSNASPASHTHTHNAAPTCFPHFHTPQPGRRGGTGAANTASTDAAGAAGAADGDSSEDELDGGGGGGGGGGPGGPEPPPTVYLPADPRQWAADVVRENEAQAVWDADKKLVLEQVCRGVCFGEGGAGTIIVHIIMSVIPFPRALGVMS